MVLHVLYKAIKIFFKFWFITAISVLINYIRIFLLTSNKTTKRIFWYLPLILLNQNVKNTVPWCVFLVIIFQQKKIFWVLKLYFQIRGHSNLYSIRFDKINTSHNHDLFLIYWLFDDEQWIDKSILHL